MEQGSKRNATTWTAGRSGNPSGRKPGPESIASAVREKYPPERLVELVGKLAESATSEQVRLAALHLLAERGYGKVRESIDLNTEPRLSEEEYAEEIALILREGLAAMTTAERLELIASIEHNPTPTSAESDTWGGP